MGRLRRLNSKRSASFAARDLEAEKVCRPDDAISFYRAARAERVRFTKFFAEQGVEHPSNRADAELQRQAISQIMRTPVLRTARSQFYPSTDFGGGLDWWSIGRNS